MVNVTDNHLLMASKEKKVPEKVPCKFYVDDQCIDCMHCQQDAPDFLVHVQWH